MATVTARVVELERQIANIKQVQTAHENRLNSHGDTLIANGLRRSELTVSIEAMKDVIDSMRARLEALEGKRVEQEELPSVVADELAGVRVIEFRERLANHFMNGAIGAIKAVREVTGLGLRESKNLVESWGNWAHGTRVENRPIGFIDVCNALERLDNEDLRYVKDVCDRIVRENDTQTKGAVYEPGSSG